MFPSQWLKWKLRQKLTHKYKTAVGMLEADGSVALREHLLLMLEDVLVPTSFLRVKKYRLWLLTVNHNPHPTQRLVQWRKKCKWPCGRRDVTGAAGPVPLQEVPGLQGKVWKTCQRDDLSLSLSIYLCLSLS